MIHHATSAFWECYNQLPVAIQQLADKNYELLKADPEHGELTLIGCQRQLHEWSLGDMADSKCPGFVLILTQFVASNSALTLVLSESCHLALS